MRKLRKLRTLPPHPLVIAIIGVAKRQQYSAFRLAKESGLGKSTCHYLLTGQGSPTIDTLEAVCVVLNLKIEWRHVRR